MFRTAFVFCLTVTVFGAAAVPLAAENAKEAKNTIDCTICHLFISIVEANMGLSLSNVQAIANPECHVMGPFMSECTNFIQVNGPSCYQKIHSGANANSACSQWC
uniref:Saposin B-type domain-containing protein n=1 Tax=Plectus sambesii TaxID=2011161 RepID=A0A914W6S6_9BILA